MKSTTPKAVAPDQALAELAERQATSSTSGRDQYFDLVDAMAAGNPVTADSIDAALQASGFSVETLQGHIQLAKEALALKAEAEEFGDLSELVAAEQEAQREHGQLLERHRQIVAELPQAEQESLTRCRVSESAVKRARKAIARSAAAAGRLEAERSGEDPAEAAEPTPVDRRIPTCTVRPPAVTRDPAVWDHCMRNDGTTFWRNKRTGEVQE